MSELTKCTAALIRAIAVHCDITVNGPDYRAEHNVWDIVDIAKGLDQVAGMSDPAAEIAAKEARIAELEEAGRALLDRLEEHGEFEDGCFYYYGKSASELEHPMSDMRAALEKKP